MPFPTTQPSAKRQASNAKRQAQAPSAKLKRQTPSAKLKRQTLFAAGNATYKSPFLSVGWSDGLTFTLSMRTAFTTSAQLIKAPAQPPAT